MESSGTSPTLLHPLLLKPQAAHWQGSPVHWPAFGHTQAWNVFFQLPSFMIQKPPKFCCSLGWAAPVGCFLVLASSCRNTMIELKLELRTQHCTSAALPNVIAAGLTDSLSLPLGCSVLYTQAACHVSQRGTEAPSEQSRRSPAAGDSHRDTFS